MKKYLSLLLLMPLSCYAQDWECVSRAIMCHTWRLSVPGGWVVSGESNTDDAYAMTYVPDKDHEWKI